jgi:AcrR family transcriptional regulator
MQTPSKPVASLADRKRHLVRETILDAAERLVRSGAGGDLTMRALAEEAGVSLTTPFKHFGSKAGILAGLMDRMFEGIAERYGNALPCDDPVSRLFSMGRAGVQIILSDPKYYRYICRSIATEGDLDDAIAVRWRAEQLWRLALASDSFPRDDIAGLYETYVPQQLGVVFRGVLIMWVTGEVADAKFARAIETSLAGVMLGLVEDRQRPNLLTRLATF